MAMNIQISAKFKKQGWKVKIRDKERSEDPHVTIIKGVKAWRLNLRSKEFMDTSPPEKEVPEKLKKEILEEKKFKRIIEEWNKMYPWNKVDSQSEEAENG